MVNLWILNHYAISPDMPGGIRLENDVTVLEDDVKLDDQVHIGHNARIGARSFLARGAKGRSSGG